MPNLVFVGFPVREMSSTMFRLKKILSEFSLDDFVVTTLSRNCRRSPPDNVSAVELESTEDADHTFYHPSAPYVIVRDTDDGRMLRVAHLLNEGLNVDVEAELIDAFFPKRK